MAEEPHKLGVHHHKPGTVSPQVEEQVEEAFLAAQRAAAQSSEVQPLEKPSIPKQPPVVTNVEKITGAPIVPKAAAPEETKPQGEVVQPPEEPTFPQTLAAAPEAPLATVSTQDEVPAVSSQTPPVPELGEQDISHSFQIPASSNIVDIALKMKERADKAHIETATGAPTAGALMNDIKETAGRYKDAPEEGGQLAA